MMKRALLIGLICCTSFAFAQDPKFSQYFAAPLTLNPALTGYFDGNYRVAVNTRQQWANVGDSYNTYSASGEVKFRDEFYYNDIFSLGISGLYDESFSRILKSQTYSISGSYYKFLNGDHTLKLGLAPQLAYVSKSLDYDALTVASQYQNGDFNLSIPNNLGLDNDKLTYFDFNIGGNLAYSTDKFSAALGYSVFHLTRPQESLFNDTDLRLPMRKTLHASMRYLSADLIDFNFSTHYMVEGESSDLIFGGLMGLKPTLESNMKLNGGIWYKANERSIFPFIGFEVGSISLGLNYSLFTKTINSYKPRTFEISFILSDNTFTRFKNTCKF
jgi:type IX secretion system PorP/SprF family membrane protein